MNILRGALPVLSSALLLSCGGGGGGGGNGGGGGDPDSPPTVTLRASPGTVSIGGTTTLTWTSSSTTTSCVATGDWSGSLPVSGSATSPAIYMTSEFGVRCANAAGAGERTALINVRTPEFTLTATPAVVQRGQPATIRWQTKDLQYCDGDWGFHPDWPLNGSEQIVLSDSEPEVFRRQFTMQCQVGNLTMRRTAVVQLKVLYGQVLMPYRISIDGDVNDPEAPLFANDTPENAEHQPYFSRRVGYVNAPLSGPEGRSYLGGDVSDFSYTDSYGVGDVGFRLTLPAVDLALPIGERADADLYVYDSGGHLLNASVSSGAEEFIVVPGGDSYIVEVRAVTGGVTYLLEVEPSPESLQMSGSHINAAFVPDEALVVVDASGQGAYKAQEGTNLALSRLGLARKAGASGRELRVALPATRAITPAIDSPRGTRMTAEQRHRLSTLLYIKSLAAKPGVRAASTNRIWKAEALPTDPLYVGQRWHYEMIKLPEAWDITTGSPGVTIAVVDTGVVHGHPDLEARLRDGYDMVSDPANPDLDGLDPDPGDPGFPAGGAFIFHGTHVAGTIGALTNNGEGVAGVNWSSAIMPVRVIGGEDGTTYDILQGVRYAAGLPNDSGLVPSKRADIINLSLGGSGECEEVEAAVFTEVRDAGVIVVASAGNDVSNMPHAPSSCPGVFSVASVGGSGERAWYSDFGPYVDLAAPGGDHRFDADRDHVPDTVVSTHATGAGGTPGYDGLEGTSMAAPHVAGVFSLMKSVEPSLTPGDIERLLVGGALTDNLSLPVPDELGYGVINALKAVRAASGDIDGSPRLVTMPSVLRFDGGNSQDGLRLSNGGGGVLSVTAINPSASWIHAEPTTATDANGLGVWRIVLDLTGLPFNGTWSGSLEIVTTAGTRTLPVLVADNLGYTYATTAFPIYIRIEDAATGELVRAARIQAEYPGGYRVDDLPPGQYHISAGTDLNHDGEICDRGELCGEHPFFGLHQVLDYVDTSEGIDVPLVITAKQDALP